MGPKRNKSFGCPRRCKVGTQGCTHRDLGRTTGGPGGWGLEGVWVCVCVCKGWWCVLVRDLPENEFQKSQNHIYVQSAG